MIGLLSKHDPSSPALIDADSGVTVCYGELCDRASEGAARLQQTLAGNLVFQLASNTISSIVAYLACLEAGIPLALLESVPVRKLTPLLDTYRPSALLLPADSAPPLGSTNVLSIGDYRVARLTYPDSEAVLHPDLALLLTTSGSTGSPKFVRLTKRNLVSNANAIASYLELGPGERAVQSLPMQYSYGLSLINSHLRAGASVVLTRHSFLRPEFWHSVDSTHCSSFAGVPYMYETLDRLRFEPKKHGSLRTMTQAGGGLRPDLISAFHIRAEAAGCRFFVMYGQTEATARISYVPPARLREKIGSIGVPIPGGKLMLAREEEIDSCQLLYSGPNVMMGYAESLESLSRGDELQGVLKTGDLARVDSEGFFYLTGRLTRFAKLFGRRLSLEDIERELEHCYAMRCAVVEKNDRLLIFAEAREDVSLPGITKRISEDLNLPPKYINIQPVDAIPMTASGKKDYRALS